MRVAACLALQSSYHPCCIRLCLTRLRKILTSLTMSSPSHRLRQRRITHTPPPLMMLTLILLHWYVRVGFYPCM